MGIQSLTYEAPVRRSARRERLDYDLLEQAGELAEQGRPLESLTKVFAHLFPGASIPNLAEEPFRFTQGSSRVTAQIDGDDVAISVPLARLPEGGKAVAAMRFVLTKISATGQLYQPRLRGDDIHLEYRDRLSRLHPAKILEVLRRMPAEADDNDDWLIGQFGALPLDRAPITPLDAAELARAEAIWRAHWSEVEELLKECQRKRSMFFLNETTAYATHRIAYVLPLGGFLAARLDESAGTFNDGHEDPLKREASLAKCIKEMKAVTTEELEKSLGHATYALSPQDDGSPKVISQYLGDEDYIDTIKELKSSGKPLDAALALVATYSYLLARFSWAPEVEAELQAGLAAASGKSWRDAAGVLLEHAAKVADRFGSGEEDDEEEDDEDDEDEDEDDEDEDEEDE